ncbi:glycosyltransferase family 2 protein [Devosia aquimaris]|uniref:glycosyltransferase family 2 protein n=1 Tax=Devosia aquimaris TaxID=2866214 RepID=UPI001CD1661F|nr:glycosyltransferase family 2 protein [Devosia sp. CJK-A8-3]
MTDSISSSPTVTIITPAYNAEGFIAATLRSAIAQTYGSFELLVLDDHSKDRTAEVAEDFARQDDRIRVIRLPRNYGAPAGPRNVGIQQARGKWIAFLDADDIWHPDKLRIQIEALEKSGARFCSTQMTDFVDESELKFGPVGAYAIRRISFLSQLVKYQTPTSSVMVDAQTLRATPFNEDPAYKAREDLDCWLKCHERLGYSIKVQYPLMGYRQSPQQISGKKLQMVGRHYHVLKKYRLDNGRGLGPGAALFTATHFLSALPVRLLGGGV